MKTKLFYPLALLAAVTLAGCVQTDQAAKGKGEHTLIVSLPDDVIVGTRGVEPQQSTGKTAIDDATVFLMMGQTVYSVETFDQTEITNKQKRIEQVPASISNVIVVANSYTDLSALTNETQVKEYLFSVSSQYTKTGLGGKTHIGWAAPRDLLGGETEIPTDDGHDYKLAKMTLNSLTSRIEVGHVKPGVGVKSVDMVAVYVNKYYANSQVAVQGGTESFHPEGHLVWREPTAAGTPSATEYLPPFALNDYTEPLYRIEKDASVRLDDASPCYAFHVYSGNLPHVILLVRGEYEDNYFDPVAQTKYFLGWVTFTKFRDTSTATHIDKMLANKIYKMGVGSTGIVINAKDIFDKPEKEGYDLGVDITMADWSPVTVTPEV